jgi:pimeloyl-ACP methyl ester carboxylesterase
MLFSHPQINAWVISGHSLGGTIATQYVYENPSKIRGLVLWAAYSATGKNLSRSDFLVTTIHGSNYGIVSETHIYDSLNLLPASTMRIEIDGGNQAQFGW